MRLLSLNRRGRSFRREFSSSFPSDFLHARRCNAVTITRGQRSTTLTPSGLSSRLRRLLDRVFFPRRRRRAIELLRGRRITRVLVLCHGNICRSPFAAALLERGMRERGANGVEVLSAGFVGPDRPAPVNARVVAAEYGLDISSHVSRLVTGHSMQRADLIVVMSADQARDARWRGAPAQVPVIVLGDLDPRSDEGRTILDPWNCSEDVFRVSYQRIDRCVQELAVLLRASHRTGRSA